MTEQMIKTADVTDADLEAAQMAEAVEVADDMMGEAEGSTNFLRFMLEAQGAKMEKPDAADAPEGATVLLQNKSGIWVFGNTLELALHINEGVWVSLDGGEWAFEPELMGWSEPDNWMNSVELLSDDVNVVPLPVGKPSWDEAPEGAKVLIGADGAWRFVDYGAVVATEEGFMGIGAGGYLPKVWFVTDMPEGEMFIEYPHGEPSEEELHAMGKPSWDLAPEDATVLVRSSNGAWRFGSFAEVKIHTDEDRVGWVPSDMDENGDSEMEGEFYRASFNDVSPIEVVAEYRPVVEG